MLLAEAVIYLRRAIKRRLGNDITVRLLAVDSGEFKQSPWVKEGPLPLVIINGQIFAKGSLSFRAIIEELRRQVKIGG